MKISKKDYQRRVKEYVDIYPNKTLYFTEDGNCFLDKNPCVDHANKSKLKWEEVKPEGSIDNDEEGMTKEEASKKLAQMDISDDTDYETAIELYKALELEATSKKKEDILFALIEYKQSLISE